MPLSTKIVYYFAYAVVVGHIRCGLSPTRRCFSNISDLSSLIPLPVLLEPRLDQVSGCDGDDDYHYGGGGGGGGNPYDSSDPYEPREVPDSWNWRSGASGDDGGFHHHRGGGAGGDFDPQGGGGFRGEILKHPGEALKKAAGQGVAWLTDALGKLKTAAEDTAYAASRPRHW